jgi:hypothetical protein
VFPLVAPVLRKLAVFVRTPAERLRNRAKCKAGLSVRIHARWISAAKKKPDRVAAGRVPGASRGVSGFGSGGVASLKRAGMMVRKY